MRTIDTIHRLASSRWLTLLLLLAISTATSNARASSEVVQEAIKESAAAPTEKCAAPPATAPVCTPRTLDEVWYVSTRGLGCPDIAGETPFNFRVSRLELASNRWVTASLEEFIAAQQPDMPSVFYVHGNRLEAGEDQQQGLSVYRQLTRGVSGELPIRFVIYAWPAAPTPGVLEDARRKAARTNIEGFYLAWLVDQLDPQVPVDFIGYSFGGRIVTGALHLLAGGALTGRALPEPRQPRAPMEAVLLAAAVDNDWLAIGRPHGEALDAVDEMLALNNHCDRALKRYGKIDPCNHRVALGLTGAVGPLGDNGGKLRQVDICCIVGKSHDWENFFYTPSLVRRIRPYVGLAE